MSLQTQLNAASTGRPTVITVGTFDGVHVGHALLLRATVELANDIDADSVAITFKYPPRELLNPELLVPHLGPLNERRKLIESRGINHLIEIDFDASIRNLEADEFVRILIS